MTELQGLSYDFRAKAHLSQIPLVNTCQSSYGDQPVNQLVFHAHFVRSPVRDLNTNRTKIGGGRSPRLSVMIVGGKHYSLRS